MNNDITPIFIMGAPRSGTTMLASMLASRDEIIALPEMQYIHSLLKEELLFGELDENYVANKLSNHFMFRDLSIVDNADGIKDLVSAKVKETVFNIIDLYNRKYVNKSYNYWVEHTPHNHLYYKILLYFYPNAKFIHIVRDGRAVYSSTKEVDWGYKDVVRGSEDWRDNVESCLELSKIYPHNVITIKYENLTSQPEDTIRFLCEYLGIGYMSSMLISTGLRKPSFAKYEKDLGKIANVKSQNKWRYLLKRYEIEHFTAFNRKLLNHLGYETGAFDGDELRGIKRKYCRLIGLIKGLYFRRKANKRLGAAVVNKSGSIS